VKPDGASTIARIGAYVTGRQLTDDKPSGFLPDESSGHRGPTSSWNLKPRPERSGLFSTIDRPCLLLAALGSRPSKHFGPTVKITAPSRGRVEGEASGRALIVASWKGTSVFGLSCLSCAFEVRGDAQFQDHGGRRIAPLQPELPLGRAWPAALSWCLLSSSDPCRCRSAATQVASPVVMGAAACFQFCQQGLCSGTTGVHLTGEAGPGPPRSASALPSSPSLYRN
jgi:hypothetical protein